jgi:hypothetical protein
MEVSGVTHDQDVVTMRKGSLQGVGKKEITGKKGRQRQQVGEVLYWRRSAVLRQTRLSIARVH